MNDDLLYLIHMLERIERIETYVRDGREVFLQSLLIQDAVIRSLEVIGEAATHVSQALRQAYPTTPWRSVIGLRNVLIHNYVGVDIDEVWRIVESDLPGFKQDLTAMRVAQQGTQPGQAGS